ncbi:MAG TPA: ABC transporter substrate-binding protein [Ktedonobacteraceae bacterium]|nr:ABC transporter substrate-binding protein [Ktedonobacteraceae bacterium]
MSTRHRSSIILPALSLLITLALLLAACGSGGAATTTSGASSSTAKLKNVSIGLGYIPDVQFAPFYVAKSKGYYTAAGLNVTFIHGIVPDLIGSLVAGKSNFVFAGGDEMLTARDKGAKVVDVATIFQKYPVSLIVPADSPIKSLADLKGHTVGVPGAYGSTYTGLLALLYSAHLSLSDIKVQSIGFTQVPALMARRVDAVMGYSNNEPLQLRAHGFAVRTFDVSDYQPLVSNGIITTQDTYRAQPQMVRGFVQATLKGLKDVIADPSGALQISKSYIPGLTNTTQAMNVLQATIPVWQGKGKLGYNDSATWQSMESFMVALKMIKPISDLSQAYTNQTVV